MLLCNQGAGGNGNVLKEIVEPLGAVYELRAIPLGDPTLSAMEIWGAEYQENNAILVHPESLDLVREWDGCGVGGWVDGWVGCLVFCNVM